MIYLSAVCHQDVQPSHQFSHNSSGRNLYFIMGSFSKILLSNLISEDESKLILSSRGNVIRVEALNKTNIYLVTIFTLSWFHVIYGGRFNLQLITPVSTRILSKPT